MNSLSTAVLLAAEVAPDDSKVRPGAIAFALFIGLAVATFFLWRSMNKQLKKVPKSFDADTDADADTDTGPAQDPPPAAGESGPSVDGSSPPGR